VLGGARRRLADRHAAEDVFQATFLALARSAARLRGSGTLAGWLHTVACRLARKEQARAARRPRALAEEPPARRARPDALAQLSGRELMQAIDEELACLPQCYRLPLLLCGVEGLARDEAAARLGWSLGALRGRLERGRELLRRRLAERGLAVPALLLGLLTADGASAVSPALAASVTRAALAVPLAASLPRPALALLVAAALLVAVSAGAGLALRPDEASPSPEPRRPALAVLQPPAAAPQPAKPAPRVDRYGDPLPEGAVARIGTNRLVQFGNVVAFSPDGRLIAVGGENDTVVRVWETKDGKPVAVLKPERSPIRN
jgi:RNA polymerase sigma factor (sigma-70 family)